MPYRLKTVAAAAICAALFGHAAWGQTTTPRAEPPAQGAPVPSGWAVTGDGWKSYRVSRDASTAHTGAASAAIAFDAGADAASATPSATTWAALTQTIDAAPWLGKRLRMTAWIKTKAVGEASVWMRVDASDHDLRFDNMEGRGTLKGDNGWTRADVVLDVPLESKSISFGSLVVGQGDMWVDDFQFDAVDGTVRDTNLLTVEDVAKSPRTARTLAPLNADKRWPGAEMRAAPLNLGFEAP